MNILNILFGNGLGSFNYIIDEYFIRFFNYSTMEGGIIQGSRLIVFTLLLETGIFGFTLFLFIIFKLHSTIDKMKIFNNNEKSMLKLILVSLFIGAIINASFLFVVGYIMVLYYYFYDKFVNENFYARPGY